MFKKIIWISLFYALNLQAQINTQVYGIKLDSMQRWVEKKPIFFKYLKKKFQKTDLPQDELILLYYGSSFLPDYHPKDASKDLEKITQMMGQMDFESALKIGESLLIKYPVEARLYMLLGYAAKKTGDEKKSKFYYKKYGDLLRVALYSGTGKDPKNAFVVRSTSDEFLILNQKNLELLRQELRYYNKIPYDKMILAPKSNPILKQTLYFNVYLPVFIGNHKTYKDIQKEAIIKFKIDTTQLNKTYFPNNKIKK